MYKSSRMACYFSSSEFFHEKNMPQIIAVILLRVPKANIFK